MGFSLLILSIFGIVLIKVLAPSAVASQDLVQNGIPNKWEFNNVDLQLYEKSLLDENFTNIRKNNPLLLEDEIVLEKTNYPKMLWNFSGSEWFKYFDSALDVPNNLTTYNGVNHTIGFLQDYTVPQFLREGQPMGFWMMVYSPIPPELGYPYAYINFEGTKPLQQYNQVEIICFLHDNSSLHFNSSSGEKMFNANDPTGWSNFTIMADFDKFELRFEATSNESFVLLHKIVVKKTPDPLSTTTTRRPPNSGYPVSNSPTTPRPVVVPVTQRTTASPQNVGTNNASEISAANFIILLFLSVVMFVQYANQ